MRLLFLGDIMGRIARHTLVEALPGLRKRLGLDFVVVNGENAAGGFGITETIADEFFYAGVDVITTGNHAFDQRGSQECYDNDPRLLRPVNYPPGAPGNGYGLFETADGRAVLVINAMARIFMDPMDDPFAAVGRLLDSYALGREVQFTLLDFHGEATSEKMAMGHFCDGRASCVVGTHSHVPTADAMILPGGTAYQTDAGMCGDYNSVIGMQIEEPLRRFTTKLSGGRFNPAQGEATLCGIVVDSDDVTGLARRIQPLRLGGCLSPAWPDVSPAPLERNVS